MGIKKVEFEVESICPLLMDKFNGDIKAKTEEEYMKEAERKVYTDENGMPCIEAGALKAVIRSACSELGKKMEGKKNRQAVKAGVFIKPAMLTIGKKKYDILRKDIVSRAGTGDKVTRVPTYRPQFDTWKVKGQMDLIGIEPDFVRQALELGGLKYGLYGFRPEFGRFIVTKFIEVKSK